MNIFLDTNIYLNFYNLSNEDLEELNKLLVLQKKKDINIYLPKQVEDEFLRNRESTIKNALQQFKEDSLKDKIPNMAKTYEEYTELEKAKKNYSEAKNSIMEKMEKDIANQSLKADELIKGIFENAIKIEMSKDTFTEAFRRHNVGNPPGKKDSLGDAINWELLLLEFSRKGKREKRDLCIISSDGDFRSELDDDEPKPFLVKEWQDKAKGNLSLFKRISLFTKKHFPDINIAAESEKQLSIANFIESGSFRNTHHAASELSKFSDFSDYQVTEILKACLSNGQISSILDDEDITEFIVGILEKYSSKISYPLRENVANKLSTSTDNEVLNARVKQAQIWASIPF
jgi:predicted nucleic acid-binding protein